MVENKERLLWARESELYKSIRFNGERYRGEHEVNEKHDLVGIDLRDRLKFGPGPVILRPRWVDYGRYLERGNGRQVATDLLGDNMAVCIGMADNKNALHGTQSSLVARAMGMEKVTLAFARSSLTPPSDCSRSFTELFHMLSNTDAAGSWIGTSAR